MTDGTALNLQTALVARLRGAAAVTALVPADAIFDRSDRPERPVCIIVGEDQMIREEMNLADDTVRNYFTLHVWRQARDFGTVKNIVDAIRLAIRDPWSVVGADVIRFVFESVRYIRDPDAEYVHAVVTLNALVQEPVT
jgi:hypothetical protein